jgi:hypothetical protein
MTTALTPPGDLVKALATLNGYRRKCLYLETLPPASIAMLDATVLALQAHIDRDPNGPVLDDAMNRIRDALDRGRLGDIQSHDLTRLSRFLLTVPTTRRPG